MFSIISEKIAFIFSINFKAINNVLKKSKFQKSKIIFVLSFYYFFSFLNALFESFGIILIIDIFVNQQNFSQSQFANHIIKFLNIVQILKY